MFVFHALGFLPSTLRQDSRHRVTWILSLVVHHRVPSPMVLVYPVGSENPRGGGASDGSGNLWSGEKPILPDEVTPKSSKTTCVVVFFVKKLLNGGDFLDDEIQNPQLKEQKHGEIHKTTYQRKSCFSWTCRCIFLRSKFNPLRVEFLLEISVNGSPGYSPWN